MTSLDWDERQAEIARLALSQLSYNLSHGTERWEVAEMLADLARGEGSSGMTSLGIDPGPVPGLFLARWEPGVREAVLVLAWQCPAADAPGLLAEILDEYGDSITCGQIEEFRTGRGAGSRGRYADRTRGSVGELDNVAAEHGLKLAVRHSSQVMPWASDKRLKEAGLYKATVGKQHSRAASRHCLFCAVADGGLPDPLSKKAP